MMRWRLLAARTRGAWRVMMPAKGRPHYEEQCRPADPAGMLWPLTVLVSGINYKTAPLRVRERFFFTGAGLRQAQQWLGARADIAAAVILATCNRTELYVVADARAGATCGRDFFCAHFPVSERLIKKHFYSFPDAAAVRHLFRVAAGLESQVLGEREIWGQVKTAWDNSRAAGLCGGFLDAVFAQAVAIGAAVRQRTNISQGNVSIGSVAMKTLRNCVKTLPNRAVLLIGAGDTAGTMGKYLRDEQVATCFVANRTYARACALARECRGEAVRFNRLPEKLATADIVISATASPHLLLRKPVVAQVMAARRQPMVLLDLAVPRDIDPAVRDIDGVSLYDLDDLRGVIEVNYNNRKKEVSRVEAMLDEALKGLYETIFLNAHV